MVINATFCTQQCLPIILYYQKWPAGKSGIISLLRVPGSEGRMFRTHSTRKREVLPRLARFTDALTTRSGKSVSECIPSCQVERKIVNPKDLKFRRVMPQWCVVSVVQKILFPKSAFSRVQGAGARGSLEGMWSSGLARQWSDLTAKLLSALVLFSLPISLVQNIKTPKTPFHACTLDGMQQSLVNHFCGTRRHSDVKAVTQNNPRRLGVNRRPALCIHAGLPWRSWQKRRRQRAEPKWTIHLSSMCVTRASLRPQKWDRGRQAQTGEDPPSPGPCGAWEKPHENWSDVVYAK